MRFIYNDSGGLPFDDLGVVQVLVPLGAFVADSLAVSLVLAFFDGALTAEVSAALVLLHVLFGIHLGGHPPFLFKYNGTIWILLSEIPSRPLIANS